MDAALRPLAPLLRIAAAALAAALGAACAGGGEAHPDGGDAPPASHADAGPARGAPDRAPLERADAGAAQDLGASPDPRPLDPPGPDRRDAAAVDGTPRLDASGGDARRADAAAPGRADAAAPGRADAAPSGGAGTPTPGTTVSCHQPERALCYETVDAVKPICNAPHVLSRPPACPAAGRIGKCVVPLGPGLPWVQIFYEPGPGQGRNDGRSYCEASRGVWTES